MQKAGGFGVGAFCDALGVLRGVFPNGEMWPDFSLSSLGWHRVRVKGVQEIPSWRRSFLSARYFALHVSKIYTYKGGFAAAG